MGLLEVTNEYDGVHCVYLCKYSIRAMDPRVLLFFFLSLTYVCLPLDVRVSTPSIFPVFVLFLYSVVHGRVYVGGVRSMKLTFFFRFLAIHLVYVFM